MQHRDAAMTDDAGALLRRLELVRSLPAGDLDALAAIVQVRRYDPAGKDGGAIFSDHDLGDEMFFVISGKVAIHLRNAGGTRILLESVEAGGFFGEVAMLGDGRRSAGAQAIEPSVLLSAKRDDLLPVLHAHPDIMLAMFRDTARRLARSSASIRKTTVRNPNDIIRTSFTPAEELVHRIARFSGSPLLIYFGALGLGAWIVVAAAFHVNPLKGVQFNVLALLVSLISIAVTCIVLHSQTLQADRDRERNDAATEANLKNESAILHLHEKLDDIDAEFRRRLPKEPGDGETPPSAVSRESP
ncbi:MAG TPA: cyclic nucleotide-binding domain-containing protein [Chthonomonadaceae bacterium]|nr:cyclic nucleotide-binding domain-containing protein [Chthonomonadaceae bacterium]